MLALNGGSPVRTAENWPRWPIFTAETEAALKDVLGSRRWSIAGFYNGKRTREQEFARQWAEFNGVPYAVPTTNGTSSLNIALEALDVGAGDEVIVPALTWIAPATAVINVNATPVIVDVDPNTFCLDVNKVREAITPKTRAIIAVHLYGSMVHMDDLLALAREKDLQVIEDCAQSHGSRWNGKNAGTMGHIGCFSMHQGKVMTSGEGGCAITSDPRLFSRMEQLRSDGRRYLPEGVARVGHMQLQELGEVLGCNYCLSEFQAALLIDGLSRLDEQNRHRQENAYYLDAQLEKLGLIPVKRPAQVERQTFYHYMIRSNPADFAGRGSRLLCEALEAELGFWFHPPYPPLSAHPLFKPQTKRRYKLNEEHWAKLDPTKFKTPVAEKAFAENLVFHHSVLLGTKADMDAIVEGFAKVKKHAADIPLDLASRP